MRMVVMNGLSGNTYTPACRPDGAAQCSQCLLSYQCRTLESERRPVFWPAVAFGAVVVLTAVSELAARL